MKVSRYLISTTAIVALVVSSYLVDANVAVAATSYDDVVSLSETVQLQDDTLCEEGADYYSSWESEFIVNAPSSFYDGAAMTQAQAASLYETKLYSGVTQITTDSLKMVAIWWTDAPATSINFELDGWRHIAPVKKTGSGVFAWIFVMVGGPNCYPVISGSGYTSGNGFLSVAVDATDFSALGVVYDVFYAEAASVAYPSGYEGVAIPTTPPAAKYVAMGDSFSSGEGNPQYELGSGTSENSCHRSRSAYPRLFAETLGNPSTAFVACSGSTTGDLDDSIYGQDPQYDALSAGTDVVTLTVGGNDVGFASYALGCTVNCGPGTPAYSAVMSAISAPAFKSNLVTAYETILSSAENAQVYVMDYPYMSKDYGLFESSTRCGTFNLNGTRDVQAAMNAVISQAVTEVGDSRLHYVSTNGTGSPYEDSYLCSEEDSSSFGEYTLHPNVYGHQNYQAVLTDYLS